MDAKAKHQQVTDLFHAASEIPREKRSAWLDAAAGGDVSLKAEVESLLDCNTAPAFIDLAAMGREVHAGIYEALGIGTVTADDLGPLPERIGPFTIKGVLGRGGMGVVYLAEQDRPHRRVAIKVLRAGAASDSSLRRFDLEAEVLARLEHAGIARIYEAGTHLTPGGPLPYFAMELIEGLPITRYAEERKLGTRDRLELFEKVCDAVQHAHTKGVVHRDLKPGNILVDAGGQPKILDFGVARVTDSDIKSTIQTELWQIIGTLPYMSPEQASGDPNELDTRSDVYALGVIAYELLAGRLPYDLQKKMIIEAVRIIREEEPTRLSSIDRTLRGDIETIVAKALEKDKKRRYQSAESLAGDIRRYLKDEPISARPANTWYQLQKFGRRNKALVGGVAIAFLALAAGIVVTGIALKYESEQRVLAQENEQKANDQTARADANAAAEAKARSRAEGINEFVKQALASSDPEQGGKQDMTVVHAMRNALTELDAGSFKDDPETEADLRIAIATILKNNGQLSEAEPLNIRALEMYKHIYNGDHAKVATAMNDLAAVWYLLGRAAEAESLFVLALEMYQRLYRGDHAEKAAGLNNLAIIRQSQRRTAEAEPLFVQVLEMNRRLYRGDHQEVATSLNNLANLREEMGRVAEAELLYEQALQMCQRLAQGDDPDVARGLNNLALLRVSLGRAADAEPLFVQALDMYRRLFKGDHPSVANSLNNLAFVLNTLGRTTDAEPYYEQALEMSERLFKGDHPQVALYLGNVALVRRDLDRASEAEPLQVRALQMFQRLHEGDDPDIANSLNSLALILETLNRPTEAEPLFVQSLEMYKRLFAGDHSDVVNVLSNLANVRHSIGKKTEARPLFDDAIAMLHRLSPQESALLARVLWRSAKARIDDGDAVAALPELEEAVTVAQALLLPEHPHLKEYRDTLAKCRAALGK